MNAYHQSRNRVWASWKWALSFRSRDWNLDDYPISIRKQEPAPDPKANPNQRLNQHSFRESILNWNMNGTGDSKEDALSDLLSAFSAHTARLREEKKPIPRPGTKVPLEFASQERVNAHAGLTQDFIHRVLGFEWAFVSDESSLWDFHDEGTNEALLAKIKNVYGVSVDDIESAKLWEILNRIAVAQKA